jgi:hypothetical protein
MIFGHNTNVALGNVKYHVQTEDAGITNALIDTTVYAGGRVLHRRTNSYLDLLPLNPDREEALKLRLDDQHRQVIEEIRSGALYLPPPTQSQSRPPSPFASGSQTHDFGAVTGNSAVSGADPVPAATPPQPVQNAVAPPAPPIAPTLALELKNAKSWLSGKHATLQLSVKSPEGLPVADANITASIAGAAEPANFFGESDALGEAQIQFEMPRLGDAAIALVIEAVHRGAKGHLRFQLRARQRVPVA